MLAANIPLPYQIEVACSNNDDDHIFVDSGSTRRGAIMNDYVAMESTDTVTITTYMQKYSIILLDIV